MKIPKMNASAAGQSTDPRLCKGSSTIAKAATLWQPQRLLEHTVSRSRSRASEITSGHHHSRESNNFADFEDLRLGYRKKRFVGIRDGVTSVVVTFLKLPYPGIASRMNWFRHELRL